MERTYVKDILEKQEEKDVVVKGWVYDKRALGKISFIVLRDITGRIQVTAFKGQASEEVMETINKLSRESAIEIHGKTKKAKQAPGGVEIYPDKIIVLAEAEQPIPIDVSDFSKTELPKRLDYRFLDLHRERIQSIFRIQATILRAYREFMDKEGATECIFPSIIGSSSEGGTEMFPVQYFEKKATLSQSCQLYKQMLACSMEKVYTVFAVWRAEKHNTVRHLNESRQMDYEQCFADDKVVMDVLGRCVQHIVKIVKETNAKEIALLELKIEVPQVKYMTFKEVTDIMKKEKIHVGKDDLTGEAERKLGEMFPETIVFVHDWPLSGKPFYIMPMEKKKGEKEQLAYGFDAIYRGMEISSGGQRIHIPELLIERLKVKGLNPDQFTSYIDSFRYGAPPHAGWGLGVERLTMLILGLDNIREAVLFPRDRDRLTP